ncbi:MAG: 3-dehydroquinate synthase II [Thermoplasmata archaeon]|nr:3-dehydroquinate synthase II [Thermoplasmata archaeon]
MSADRLVLRLRGGNSSEIRALGVEARRRGFLRLLLGAPIPEELRVGPSFEEASDRVEALDGSTAVLSRISIREPADLELAATRLARGESLLVRFELERVLPLETLVAHRGRDAVLWVEVSRLAQLPAALGALEHGADAAVVEVSSASDLDALVPFLVSVQTPSLRWRALRVARVTPMGIGDRVLVDTSSLLDASEGLPLGSSAAWLFLVLSEAVGSRVTRPRPFRVNAGAPHSYTLLSNGETRYLSELEAGDSLLLGRVDGRTRSVRVGRLKIERRPMLLVEVETPNGRATLFVQEAETVRVHDGAVPISVTELAVGNRLLVAELPPARHLGRTVSEHLEER